MITKPPSHSLRLLVLGLLAVAVGCLLIGVGIGRAHADTGPVMDMSGCGTCYPEDVNHLRVDPVLLDSTLTTVPEAQAEQLANRIRHSGKPVYLLFLAGPKGGVSKAGQYMDGVAAALDLTSDESAVIAVATPKGFYATSYNTSDDDAKAVRDTATFAARTTGSPYQAASAWLNGVLPLDLTAPTPPEPIHWGPILTMIGIGAATLVLLVVAALWVIGRVLTGRRKEQEAAEAKVKAQRRRDDLEEQIGRLREDFMAFEGIPAAADYQRRGLLDLDSATTQLDDPDSARRFYESASRHFTAADDAAHPERVAARMAAAQARAEQQAREASYVQHKIKTGHHSKKVYSSPVATPECAHYWSGGQDRPAGYYSQPWWTWQPPAVVVVVPDPYPSYPGGRGVDPYGSYGDGGLGQSTPDYGGGSYGTPDTGGGSYTADSYGGGGYGGDSTGGGSYGGGGGDSM